MRRWLASILLFVLFLCPASAGAQGGTKLDSLIIELWSEFDRPSMLVIKQFVVSQDTSLPATVTLRFPKEGNLIAVAEWKDEGADFFNKAIDPPVAQGDWQLISINVETYEPHRIEYYQPLTRNGNKRQFKYQWFGDYYVKEFTVTALVPADSIDLSTMPELGSLETTANGLIKSGTVTRTDLRMGNSFQFDLEYQRSSTALTDPNKADGVQPSVPVGADTPGRVSITNLPWIIGAFGVALIGIALFSYWRSTQSGEGKPSRRRRRQSEEAGEVQAYCHECGARAHPGDHFCRTCGSRLRVEP